MISLTLYRTLAVTTVLVTIVAAMLAFEGLITDPLIGVPLVGGIIVMGAWVISMTRHPERLTKTDRTLPWWAVVSMQLLVVAIGSVLLRLIFS